MILANSELMRLSESRVMEIFNVDEELLMEIVAVKVADRILKITGNVKDKHFLVFAGRGKNGGDAIAIARHLILQGARISAFLIDDGGGSFSPLLRLQIDRLKKIAPDSMRDFNFQEIRGDFVIDGLFGTGFKGEMREPYNSVVRYINNLNIPIISIDVPSGLDASTGRVSSNCIHANYTFTLGLAKLGLFIYPGAGYGGEISLIDLGFPLDR
ncbi:MAG TPA: NAD(P)H-hydrate epimerase [bacterium]|nr:NAD(P)H-hydrate epimerase [bacterium]